MIPSGLVTTEDLCDVAGVSSRTIRNWVAAGLLPRPVLASEGYRTGVRGYYPESTLDTVSVLQATKCLTIHERRKLVSRKSRYQYRIEDDGTIILIIKHREAGA